MPICLNYLNFKSLKEEAVYCLIDINRACSVDALSNNCALSSFLPSKEAWDVENLRKPEITYQEAGYIGRDYTGISQNSGKNLEE